MKRSSGLTPGQLIIQLFKDPDRKSIARILAELVYLTFVFKTIPIHYVSRFLFKKERTNIGDYFPSKVLYNIKPYFNEKAVVEVLENKLFFDFFYRQFDISLPKILMYNYRNAFIFNKKSILVNSPDQFRLLLQEVFKINNIKDSIFVKRTYGTYGGKGIYKIALNQLEQDSPLIKDYFNEVIKTGYLFQETIKQHPELDKLNPSCVNTIRIDSFRNPDGEVELITAYIRTSMSNHYVDNTGSGGGWISVDMPTGRLEAKGYKSLKDGGITLLDEHPVTHTVFKDYTIPFFEEAKQLVIQVAGYVPNLRLIGWDVAIGESGPILVEGNSDYDVAGTDFVARGARSNPVFRKVLKEINYL